MRIARVVGNVVATIKQQTHYGYKLMIIEYLNLKLEPVGVRTIAFDAADAGIGDIVIVNVDGGAAKTMNNDKDLIADVTICGVLEHFTLGNTVVKTS